MKRPFRGNDVARALERMNLPSAVTRDAIVAGVAARRGRPIQLVPVPHSVLRGNHFGMWLARISDDVIVYTGDTSDTHATHIVCHEIAHMELHHDLAPIGDTTLDPAQLRDLTPSVGSSEIVSALGRSNYSTRQEYDAELLATHIMARVNRRGGNGDERAARILGSF
ncbi:hypothetical protein [Rhodococcus sp. NPDC058521]|uniref:hypothetical protein n=1 Tax=Rhodococcus sp. NPDC058521 TaxID=3346536 RepID=UPI00365ACF66